MKIADRGEEKDAGDKLHWTTEAESALKKVPFFVRKKAKNRIEKYVLDKLEIGRGSVRSDIVYGAVVTIEDVNVTKENFLSNMSKDIRGFQADRCFGASGCLNAANSCGSFLERAEKLLEQENPVKSRGKFQFFRRSIVSNY